MSLQPIPGQANICEADLVARADGSPIIAGTVNFYIIANTGANAGSWFRGSDNSWQAAEAIAGAMSHKSDGHWQVSIATNCWTDGVEYTEYAKESTNLHVPVSWLVVCKYRMTVDSSNDVVAASVVGNVGGNVVGSVASVTGNVAGSVASVSGNVGGNVVGSVASVSGNVGGNVSGSVGSIASGGIVTASFADSAITKAKFNADIKTGDYINAQVKGEDNIDFGALQKTSLNAATPASVTGSVASVSGNVGGNVVGSVGSVAGNVTGSVGSVAGNVTGSVGSVAGNVTGSVASVTGNVSGNVVGSVGSVAGNVTGTVGGVAGTVTTLDGALTAIASAHGAGSYLTATGFSTSADVTNAVSAIEVYGQAHWITAVGFGTPTDISNAVTSIEGYGDIHWLTTTLTAATIKTTMEAAGSTLAWVKNVSEGDIYIDITTSPWQLIICLKGTNPSVLTNQLIKKNLYQADGSFVTSTNDLVAGHQEP